MQSLTLENIVNEIIQREGGCSNNSHDLGGCTTYGITEKTARENNYLGPMSTMTVDIAKAIYTQQYIHQPQFDDIHKISPLIAEELIDTGVNMGPVIASKFLQRWLNAFNNNQEYYRDIAEDGHVGPATLIALNAFLKRRGHEGETILCRGLNCSQGAYYLEITNKRVKNETFIYGWLKNRVNTK